MQIMEFLQDFFLGNYSDCATKRKEIFASGDAQLYEMLRQAEEALEITLEELEVIINAQS